jgi:hypothetical protein
MWGISRLAEDLLAFQEGLCVEQVSKGVCICMQWILFLMLLLK